MEIGTLKKIYLYPVKSLAGIELRNVKLTSRGLEGDRKYALYNKQGKMASGKNTRNFFRLDNLLDIKTLKEKDSVFIVSNHGKKYPLTSPSSILNTYLSELLKTEITILEEGAVSHMDDGEVHLITTEDIKTLSLKHLKRLKTDKEISPKRFRPNLVIDSMYLSSELLAMKQLHIGKSTFKVIKATERCRMVTLKQGELPTDRRLLKSIASKDYEGHAKLGIYLTPIEYSNIEIGKTVSAEKF